MRVALISLVLAFSAMPFVAATVVSGTVFDTDGKGVDRSDITIVRHGVVVKVAQSDPTGKYTVNVTGDEPIDVMFGDFGHETAILSDLSGTRNHTINKILPRKGQVLDRQSQAKRNFASEYVRQLEYPSNVRRPAFE